MAARTEFRHLGPGAIGLGAWGLFKGVRTSILLTLSLLAACAGDDRAGMDTGASTGLAEDGTGDDGDDDEDGDPLLDVAPGDGDGPGDEETGCQKVDFLFVIDNSASMIHNQEALVAAFPGFIDSIKSQVAAQDYHILVTDSDEDPTIACEGAYQQVDCGDPYVCGDYPCGSNVLLDSCDKTLGAGVVTPRGGFANNAPCGVPDGRRFISQAQPDLEDTFACIATTGTSGDWNERPIEAATVAVSDAMNGAGACNEDFLRDDAILVVTVLTTGDDGTSIEASKGDAQVWYDALVAAKGGNAESIVFLAITTPFGGCDFLGCSGSKAYDSLVGMFGPRGRVYPIDSDDYVPYFQEAVELIDTTCDEYVPEG
jgi:hypothetical protein